MAQTAAPYLHARLTAVDDASREPPISGVRFFTEDEWLELQSSANSNQAEASYSS